MSLEFLSDEWFAKLDELRAELEGGEARDDAAEAVINLTIRGGPAGETRMALSEGTLHRGHRRAAAATLSLAADLAKKVLIDDDEIAGLQGYMSGQIRLDGDPNALRAFHAARLTPSQISLRRKLREVTS